MNPAALRACRDELHDIQKEASARWKTAKGLKALADRAGNLGAASSALEMRGLEKGLTQYGKKIGPRTTEIGSGLSGSGFIERGRKHGKSASSMEKLLLSQAQPKADHRLLSEMVGDPGARTYKAGRLLKDPVRMRSGLALKMKEVQRLGKRLRKEASAARAAGEAVKRGGGKAGKWLKEKLRHAGHGVVGGKSLKPGEVSALDEAKKFAKNPIKTSKESFKNMGLGERALMGGLTGMEAADIPKARGEKAERTGSLIGGTAGWLAFRKAPLVGSIAGMMAAAKGGETVAKKVKELKRAAKIKAVHG